METMETAKEKPKFEHKSTMTTGGQGVHREVESEGLEEKYRAVIERETCDEPVGQRRVKVELALWQRRHSYPPVAPRCVRTARYGRSGRDPRRTHCMFGWHRAKNPYKSRDEMGDDVQ